MSTFAVSPNPSQPSQTVTASASGYPNRKTRLRVAGSVVVGSFMPGTDGAFTRQFTVPASSGAYALELQQQKQGWRTVTTIQITVAAVTPPVEPPPVEPPPVEPPPVEPPPTSTGAYGTIAADAKANLEIGRMGDIAHRFRAPSSSAPVSIAWSQRYGAGGYSGGTGGSIVVSVVPDAGGKPGTTPIAVTAPYAQGNPGANTKYDRQMFISGMPLVAGALYWVVFHNADNAPLTNWISVNELYAQNSPAPVNPESPDNVVFSNGPSWRAYNAGVSPVMDLVLADGRHVGVGFIEAMVAQYANVGGQSMVRERFTPTSDRGPFTEIAVRARRVLGTAPLHLSLALAGVSGDTNAIPLASAGDTIHWATGWARAAVASFTLRAGTAYELRVTAPAGTTYEMVPLRSGINFGIGSRAFPEGAASKSVDGGSTWVPFYPDEGFAPCDLQWYVR